MGRSKLPVIISLVSLLIAGGSLFALFSLRDAASKSESQVKATSYSDDPQTAVEIDPADIKFKQTGQFAVDMQKPAGLAVDADGRIYVAGDKCLCRYAPDGRLEDRIPLTFAPTCVAVGQRHVVDGRVYVGFIDHVEVFDPGGSKEAIWQGVDKARFTSISAGDHDVFIADAGGNLVQHFDSTGKLLSPLGEGGSGHFAPSPGSSSASSSGHFDLVVARDDLVYVVDRRECRIEGYNIAGEVERRWGVASPAIEDFAGRNNPTQIAQTGDGRFVTVEEDPLRVKVYERSGKFAGVVCGPQGTESVADLAADQKNRVLVLDAKVRCVRIFEENTAVKPKEK